MKRVLDGWKKDPADLSFRTFDAFTPKKVTASSVELHEIAEYTPISDQGQFPSCVANAAVDALEILIGIKDPAKVVQLARLFPWWTARHEEREADQIVGCYIYRMLNCLQEYGVCLEEDWPYPPIEYTTKADEEKAIQLATSRPSAAAFAVASDNKITGWMRLIEADRALIEAVDFAVLADHPTMFGHVVDQSFLDLQGTGLVYYMPEMPYRGRHCMLIVGRRIVDGRRQFKIRNSWGLSWGDNGYVWVDEDYLTHPEAGNFSVATITPDIIV